ncbi:MAG: antibiotic biosynthesis monooxygenase [Rhodospirillaceae bacterium]|nr:antibiotic biosynthesis monooxygenase [Rhodospirillaceae bacterium]
MTDKYSIFVTMQLKPGMGDAFRPHILKNAEATRRDEVDNITFNVMVAKDDPDRYYFYEVYTDAAALDRHRESTHFKVYVEAISDMVAEKTVQATHVIDM